MIPDETRYVLMRGDRLWGRIVRAVHRLTGHRFEPFVLIDLRGYPFAGRRCACGRVEETAWQPIGSAVRRSAP